MKSLEEIREGNGMVYAPLRKVEGLEAEIKVLKESNSANIDRHFSALDRAEKAEAEAAKLRVENKLLHADIDLSWENEEKIEAEATKLREEKEKLEAAILKSDHRKDNAEADAAKWEMEAAKLRGWWEKMRANLKKHMKGFPTVAWVCKQMDTIEESCDTVKGKL